MYKNLFLPCLLFAIQAAVAQASFQWIRTPAIDLTFNGGSLGYSTACDASGNVYYAGYKTGQVAYGGEVLGTVFIHKYDTDGNLIYSNDFIGQVSVYNIANDPDGNLLVFIGFRESVTIGSQVFETSDQGIRPMLVKLNAQGDLLWQIQPQIADSVIEQSTALAIDASGNSYIGYGNYSDSYIRKLSPSGSEIFTIEQQQVKIVSSISIDDEGNIYAAGSCAGSGASYNGVEVPTDFTYNVYMARYAADGTFSWVRYVEDITCPFPVVKARTADAVYFSSALPDAFSFGDIASEGPAAFGDDFFVSRLNADGDFLWVREVPGNGDATLGNRNVLEVDGDGNVYFAGSTRGTIAWDSDNTTQTSGFSHHALLLKYNPQGDVVLSKTIVGESHNRFDSVNANSAGDIFLSGFSYGDLVLDGITHADENRFTFLTKLSETSLSNPDNNQDNVVLYPNPARDYIRLSGSFSDNNATFYNALGQKIKTATLSAHEDFPVNDLSQGVYFLKAEGLPMMRFVKL